MGINRSKDHETRQAKPFARLSPETATDVCKLESIASSRFRKEAESAFPASRRLCRDIKVHLNNTNTMRNAVKTPSSPRLVRGSKPLTPNFLRNSESQKG